MKIYRFRPKKQKNSLLFKVFVIVAIIQIALLVGFSGMIISQSIINLGSEMEAPKVAEKVEPQKQEVRARINRTQRKTTKLTKRISVVNPNNINAPSVDVKLPSGLGRGFGGFVPITGVNIDNSVNINAIEIDIQGIKSKTERVLICIDAGEHLMTDERGGLDTYKVIREDIKKLVDSLPGTVLFNLMAFECAGKVNINLFMPTLVPASDANKRRVAAWIDPINASLNRLGTTSNYTLKYPFMPQPPATRYYSPGVSDRYRVYQAAIEQGADTIYILTTGWADPDRIKYPWTDAETERFAREEDKYQRDVEKALKQAGWTEEKQLEYDKQLAINRTKAIAKARDWIEKENAKRKAAGKSLYTGNPADVISEQKLLVYPEPRPPSTAGIKRPVPKFKSYGRSGLFKFYEPLFKEVYDLKNIKRPQVNMIIFKGEKEEWTPAENKVVRSFASMNRGGKVRVLRGLKPVNDTE